MSDGTALAQGAIERLYEDEAVRGDLTDAGAKAVLDWATGALAAAGERIARTPDEEAQGTAMEGAEEALYQLLQKVLQAAREHRREDVQEVARDPLVARNFGARMRLGVIAWQLGEDIDQNAARLVGALRGVAP